MTQDTPIIEMQRDEKLRTKNCICWLIGCVLFKQYV